MESRWRQDGGYREVLKVAGPLFLSMGSWSLMHFADRMFLTWYDRMALAASMPSGLLNFAFGSFFVGTASYVNTFVAQYSGAGRPYRVGASVWQGIYFSLVSGLAMLALIPAAVPIFKAAGHEPGVQVLEVTYFQILCFMMGPAILMTAVSAFFSGRGETRTVMWVNMLAVGVNILLDYLWIFGIWGFPRWGIYGAAWATVVAHVFGALLFVGLLLRKPHRENFHTLRGCRPDWRLFRRLMRFGFPNGIQLLIEISGFALFILIVGRYGTTELAATNLAFNINTLAFVPMLGLGVAVSALVGQYLGKDRPDLAERCTWSAIKMSLFYVGSMAAAYIFAPELFLAPFASFADAETLGPVMSIATVLLRFVAFYCIFDAIYIVFAAAVKGAGDTRFVMWVTSLASLLVMVIPVYLSVMVFEWGLYIAWLFVSTYIVMMGTVFFFRFRGGKWKSMRVIEQEPSPVLDREMVSD